MVHKDANKIYKVKTLDKNMATKSKSVSNLKEHIENPQVFKTRKPKGFLCITKTQNPKKVLFVVPDVVGDKGGATAPLSPTTSGTTKRTFFGFCVLVIQRKPFGFLVLKTCGFSICSLRLETDLDLVAIFLSKVFTLYILLASLCTIYAGHPKELYILLKSIYIALLRVDFYNENTLFNYELSGL